MGTTPDSILGTATPRIDGPLKTTGTAQYAADFHFERMAHAVPVNASIASGRIRRIDASAAQQMPGVLLVLHHSNIGPLYRTAPDDDNATNSEVRAAFEDEVVRHWGQHVAVVIAETLEQATAAAGAVKVDYEPQTADLSMQSRLMTRLRANPAPNAAIRTRLSHRLRSRLTRPTSRPMKPTIPSSCTLRLPCGMAITSPSTRLRRAS